MGRLKKIIEYGLYLLVFLLPWQTRWLWHQGELSGGAWEYGTFSLYAADIILFILLLLGIAFSLQGPRLAREQNNLISWLMPVVLLVLSALTIFWSANKPLAIYAWLKLFEGIVLFWLILNIEFSRVKLAWAFVSAAVIQSLLGSWQFLTQSSFALKWLGMALHNPQDLGTSVVEFGLERWLRAYGSLPHPNVLAGFLAVAIFMILGLWLRKQEFRKIEKWLLLISYVLIIVCLFFTFSRSAWLALGIGLLIYVFRYWRKFSQEQKRINYQLAIITVVMISLLMAIYWPIVATRLGVGERLEIKSSEERITGYQEFWQLAETDWYKGVGIGNYTLAVHDKINPSQPSWYYQPVHNIFALILAELGVLGFLVFLFFIFYCLWRSGSIHGTVLPALLVIGLFDHYLWTLSFGILLFWLIVGLEASSKKTA